MVITEFYEAFRRRDVDAMAALYLPDATFSDPVFGQLDGPEVTAMWRMLNRASNDLEVSFHDVTALGERAAATWEARYTFTENGELDVMGT